MDEVPVFRGADNKSAERYAGRRDVARLGRWVALLELGVLFLLVLGAATMLVVPSDVVRVDSINIVRPPTNDLVSMECILFFVITLSLWCFDAIGLFLFRYSWMTKSIWVTAVASIIATSTLIYSTNRGSVKTGRGPFEGVWLAHVSYPQLNPDYFFVAEHQVLFVTYGDESQTYIGQSTVSQGRWFQIRSLNVDTMRADIKYMVRSEGGEYAGCPVRVEANGTRIEIGTPEPGSNPFLVLQRHGPF